MVSFLHSNSSVELKIEFSENLELFSIKPSSSESNTLLWKIGLGKSNSITTQAARRLGAIAGKQAFDLKVKNAFVDINPVIVLLGESGLISFVEGLLLSQYDRQNWKSDFSLTFPEIFLNHGELSEEKAKELLQQTKNLVEATLKARDLVNRPANMLTPEIMANEMCEMAEAVGISTEILNLSQIESHNMGGLIAVGSSSSNPPRLIVLRYRGNPSNKDCIGLIGKGVTLDTGGYCLKPSASMGGIRGDMAGAAAVFGAIMTVAKNKIPVNVTAVIPSAENRISSDSFIPGDVIRSMSGKTIEIGNTDAEGRLILVDAMTYAIQEEKVTKILDIATLTGAVVSMFGFTTAGVLSNDDDYFSHLEQASIISGEQYWRLPIFEEYKKLNESAVADLYNAPKSCGTIAAGLFIGEFNENLPWIHIDIAGTAWVDTPEWEFQSPGATGAAVSTLYYLCTTYAE